ncbi:MAG: J domain-containing protein [Francisellaceae bacterium]|nr:J domain-containing protein [Francisellaceae bacterium]
MPMPGDDLDFVDVEGAMVSISDAVGHLGSSLNGTAFSQEMAELPSPVSVEDFNTTFAPKLLQHLSDFESGLHGGSGVSALEGITSDVTPDGVMRSLFEFGNTMLNVANISGDSDIGQKCAPILENIQSIGKAGLGVFSQAYHVVEPLQKAIEQQVVRMAVTEALPMAAGMVDDVLESQGIPTGGMVKQLSSAVSPLVQNLSSEAVGSFHDVGVKALDGAASKAQSKGGASAPTMPSIMDKAIEYGGPSSDILGQGVKEAAPLVMSGADAAFGSHGLNDTVKQSLDGLVQGLGGTDLGNTVGDISQGINQHTSPEELGQALNGVNGALVQHNSTFEKQVGEVFSPTNPVDAPHQLDMFKGLQSVNPGVVPQAGQVVEAFQNYVGNYQMLMSKVKDAETLPEMFKLGVLSTTFLSAQALEDERRLVAPVLQVVAPICVTAGIQIGLPLATAALGGTDGGVLTALSPILAATGGPASKMLVSAADNASKFALDKVINATGGQLGMDGSNAAPKPPTPAEFNEFLADNKSAYAVLDVSDTASSTEINKAYKTIALANHPDKTNKLQESEQSEATDFFKKATAAKDILIDDESRKKYDGALKTDRPTPVSPPRPGADPFSMKPH